MTSGSSANLSSRSICWSNGSVMSVPSRSMNRIFLDTGQNLQGAVVFLGGADGDANVMGDVLAAVAPDDAGGAARGHRARGIGDLDEQIVGVARPDAFDGGQFGERRGEAVALGDQRGNGLAGGREP